MSSEDLDWVFKKYLGITLESLEGVLSKVVRVVAKWQSRFLQFFKISGPILSPQSCCRKSSFTKQKLDLQHFYRKCREHLNIPTLRKKF